MKEDLIFLNHSASTKEEVIQFLCEKAVEKNYVPEHFYDSVMEREYISYSGWKFSCDSTSDAVIKCGNIFDVLYT